MGFQGQRGQGGWFDSKDALWVETADRVVYRPPGGPFLDPDQPLLPAPWHADFAEAADGPIWMAELANSAHILRRVGERTRTEVWAPAQVLEALATRLRSWEHGDSCGYQIQSGPRPSLPIRWRASRWTGL